MLHEQYLVDFASGPGSPGVLDAKDFHHGCGGSGLTFAINAKLSSIVASLVPYITLLRVQLQKSVSTDMTEFAAHMVIVAGIAQRCSMRCTPDLHVVVQLKPPVDACRQALTTAVAGLGRASQVGVDLSLRAFDAMVTACACLLVSRTDSEGIPACDLSNLHKAASRDPWWRRWLGSRTTTSTPANASHDGVSKHDMGL